MDWYYAKHGKQEGPVEKSSLQGKIKSGEVVATDLVWREGMSEWTPAGEVPELREGEESAVASPQGAQGGGGVSYQTPQTPLSQQTYMAAPTNGLAIASLVCGIISVVLCYVHGVVALPAVICGHMALKQIRESPQPMGGQGMAIAGLVTGYIGLLFQMGTIALIMMAIGGHLD